MNRRIDDELRQLHCPDDRSVEELAEQYPALDAAAIDRIDAMCERKLSERMNMTEMMSEAATVATGVTKITRTQWIRPVTTAAACLLLVAGVAGTALLGGNKLPSTTPLPVSTDVTDPDSTTDPDKETTPNTETIPNTETNANTESASAVIVTETVVSAATTDMTAAMSDPTAAASTAAATSTTTVSAVENDEIFEGLTMSDLYALFDRNVRCMEYFCSEGLPTSSETVDEHGFLYPVTSVFTSFAELESFVRDTYVSTAADEILTEYPLGGPLYKDYNGKLCFDNFYAVQGYCYTADWKDVKIFNPARVAPDRVVFDVVDISDQTGMTCDAYLENGVWKLEKLYGYDKVEQDHMSKEAFILEQTLHQLALADLEMDIYCIEDEPLEGTALYPVDYTHAGVTFTDGASFEKHLKGIYHEEAVDYMLNHYIYRVIDNVVYVDTEKAEMDPPADSYVDWREITVYDIQFKDETTCTFSVYSNADPAADMEYTAAYVDGSWKICTFPTRLLK